MHHGCTCEVKPLHCKSIVCQLCIYMFGVCQLSGIVSQSSLGIITGVKVLGLMFGYDMVSIDVDRMVLTIIFEK